MNDQEKAMKTIELLFSFFSCPICHTNPPYGGIITQCLNGHWICEICNSDKEVIRCVVCRSYLPNVARNLVADEVINVLGEFDRECCFCKEKFPYKKLSWHEIQCPSKILYCAHYFLDCQWTFQNPDLQDSHEKSCPFGPPQKFTTVEKYSVDPEAIQCRYFFNFSFQRLKITFL